MRREFFILMYVTLMGSIVLSSFVFLGRYFIFWINGTTVPLEDLFYISLKIGVFGGGIGGISTWLIHFFNQRYRK